MALKRCKECGGQVSSKAKMCPGCGAPVKQTSAGCGCLSVIVIAVVIVALMNSGEKDSSSQSGGGQPSESHAAPTPPQGQHDKIAAWTMAEDFIKQKLKSPSSADFGSVFGDYQSPETCVTDLGNGKYHCVGWVDAQNSLALNYGTILSST